MELARLTKLPIHTQRGRLLAPGFPTCQMELAHRDGVLIPEQKAEPGRSQATRRAIDSRPRDSSSCRNSASRPTSRNWISSASSQHHGAIQYLTETVIAHAARRPRIPETRYRICQKRGGSRSRGVERLIAKSDANSRSSKDMRPPIVRSG